MATRTRQRYNTVDLHDSIESNKVSINGILDSVGSLVKGQAAISTQVKDLLAYVTSPSSWTPEKQAEARVDALSVAPVVDVAGRRSAIKSDMATAKNAITRLGIAGDTQGMIQAQKRYGRLQAELSALVQPRKARTTPEQGAAQAAAAARQRAIQAQSDASTNERTASRVSWDSDVSDNGYTPGSDRDGALHNGVAYTWDTSHPDRLHVVLDVGRMVDKVSNGKVVAGKWTFSNDKGGAWLNMPTVDGLHRVYFNLGGVFMARQMSRAPKGERTSTNPFVS